MESAGPRDTLGMSQDELLTYFEELLILEATEAAAQNKTSVEDELVSPGFASVRASASYFIQLITANNAFIARFLLDREVLPTDPALERPAAPVE
ncbi:MAG: hypothetical protein H0V24_17425 [Chloroflexia bacterium]|nr:hypothetical protein [Chloroflexia bacterium]